MSRLPVLLVPGWSDRASALEPLRRHLVASGWPIEWVAAIDFRDRYGSNVQHAAEIAEAVDDLRVHSADRTVDIVAHSMGGLAVRYFLQHHSQGRSIRRVIFLGTPHAGTWAAWFAWGGGRAELKRGSDFTSALVVPEHVRAELYSLYTPLDFRVPPASAQLKGSRCHSVPCLGHRRLLRSRPSLARITEILTQ